MLRTLNRLSLLIIVFSLDFSGAGAQSKATSDPDLTTEPTLYVVGYAHLDTQWRWEYPQVIREYLPKTMHDNFALFEKYPHYVFNFSGANR
jgi:alpha-mannosidase